MENRDHDIDMPGMVEAKQHLPYCLYGYAHLASAKAPLCLIQFLQKRAVGFHLAPLQAHYQVLTIIIRMSQGKNSSMTLLILQAQLPRWVYYKKLVNPTCIGSAHTCNSRLRLTWSPCAALGSFNPMTASPGALKRFIY